MHSPSLVSQEVKSAIGTVGELVVFPLLWMPDVSICLQFGEGEIPREEGGKGIEKAALLSQRGNPLRNKGRQTRILLKYSPLVLRTLQKEEILLINRAVQTAEMMRVGFCTLSCADSLMSDSTAVLCFQLLDLGRPGGFPPIQHSNRLTRGALWIYSFGS